MLKNDEYIKNNHVPNKYCTYRRFDTVLQQWETKSNNIIEKYNNLCLKQKFQQFLFIHSQNIRRKNNLYQCNFQ